MKLEEVPTGTFKLAPEVEAEGNLTITIPESILNKVKTDSDLAIVNDLAENSANSVKAKVEKHLEGLTIYERAEKLLTICRNPRQYLDE